MGFSHSRNILYSPKSGRVGLDRSWTQYRILPIHYFNIHLKLNNQLGEDLRYLLDYSDFRVQFVLSNYELFSKLYK